MPSLLRISTELFTDTLESEISEIVNSQPEPLSVEEIVEILTEPQNQKKEKCSTAESDFGINRIRKILTLTRDAIEEAMTYDPIMTQCLRFKYELEAATQSYNKIYQGHTRRIKQKRVTDYFNHQ